MATGEQAGLLDLQKELTCSICTEVLFQPLTLLDCLHTFCGSLRETRPNATVTTLLDMYLQANPGRDRTQEEQNELRSKYKPGEQVMPPLRVEKVDAVDERMLAEVREMSLRDAGVRSSGAREQQDRKARRPPTLGAHEITRRDIPENVRTTVTIEVRLVQNNASLHLIPLSQDLVFSKLI
ncbi:MAG: hypothetical protein LQ339_000849 [Xanthoria mediterranea]|nr:MAG: hypothetical protein LQ339_000849 [Xanthoria mediterranea]